MSSLKPSRADTCRPNITLTFKSLNWPLSEEARALKALFAEFRVLDCCLTLKLKLCWTVFCMELKKNYQTQARERERYPYPMWHQKGFLPEMNVITDISQKVRKQWDFQSTGNWCWWSCPRRYNQESSARGGRRQRYRTFDSYPFTLNHRRPTQMRDQRQRATCVSPLFMWPTSLTRSNQGHSSSYSQVICTNGSFFFPSPVLTVPIPDITGVNLFFLLLFFSIGLNKLPILLGATLLPVADVFSSEDLEMSTSFSCPNESETADKGDLKCDSWSQLTFVLKAEGSGVTFIILARCHSISRVQWCGLEKKEKPRLHDSLYTLE